MSPVRSGARVHHLIGYTAALEEMVARSGIMVILEDGQAEPREYSGAEAVDVVRGMWDLLPIEVEVLDAARPLVWLRPTRKAKRRQAPPGVHERDT